MLQRTTRRQDVVHVLSGPPDSFNQMHASVGCVSWLAYPFGVTVTVLPNVHMNAHIHPNVTPTASPLPIPVCKTMGAAAVRWEPNPTKQRHLVHLAFQQECPTRRMLSTQCITSTPFATKILAVSQTRVTRDFVVRAAYLPACCGETCLVCTAATIKAANSAVRAAHLGRITSGQARRVCSTSTIKATHIT